MRILVTGATGFIGRHTVRHLLASGHELAILVPPGEAAAGRGMCDAISGMQHYRGTMEQVPWREIAEFAPSACLHLAWIATPEVYLDSPENLMHLEWSQTFIRRLVEMGVRRVVVTGSCAEYAPSGDTSVAPLYVQCKTRLWEWLKQEFGNAQVGGDAFTVAWLRLFYPYGPGEAPQRLISALIASFREQRPFTVRCPAVAKDYIHVRDVASALAGMVAARYVGDADVGTGHAVSLGALATQVAELMGCPELLVLGQERDRLGTRVADTAVLRSLGWQPGISLEAGLREMVDRV